MVAVAGCTDVKFMATPLTLAARLTPLTVAASAEALLTRAVMVTEALAGIAGVPLEVKATLKAGTACTRTVGPVMLALKLAPVLAAVPRAVPSTAAGPVRAAWKI